MRGRNPPCSRRERASADGYNLAMLRAAMGLSRLADPAAAGEAAALDALVACEDARYLLAFANGPHAARLDAVVDGARGLAGYTLVTGCASHAVIAEGGVVADAPAVAVLAIAGDDLLLRPAQAPRGPAEGTALARELGAPRDGRAIVLLPGPDAGDTAEVARALSAYSGPPVFCSPGAVAATAVSPYSPSQPPELEPCGSLACLLAGPWAFASALAPAYAAGPGPWAFGLYLGTTAGDPAADLVAIRARFPDLLVAGLVGEPLPAVVAGSEAAGGLLLLAGPSD